MRLRRASLDGLDTDMVMDMDTETEGLPGSWDVISRWKWEVLVEEVGRHLLREFALV